MAIRDIFEGFKLYHLIPTVFLVLAIVMLATEGIAQLGVVAFGILFVIAGIILWCVIADSNEALGLYTIISIIETIVFLAITKPWYHWLAMWFYTNPVILEAIGISLVAALVIAFLYRLGCNSTENTIAVFLGAVVLLSLIIISLLASFTGAYSDCYLATTLDIEEIFELPAMDEDYIRVTPMKVANRYATDATQYPRHTPSKPCDITMINNKPYWSYMLVPDGFVNVYNIKPVGAVFIDMTTTRKELDIKEQTMEYSQDLALTDDIYWQIYSRYYWVECERSMTVLHNDELYIAVPFIEYDLHFTFPSYYRVPRWGGVFLVDKDGNIDKLSPEESRENLVLQGQKLFPEKLVTTYINSQKYWKAKEGFMTGIFNVWFDHIDQIEITDVSGQGNSQPFLINMETGLKWVVSVEPYGQAHGIYRIYLLDARTGEIEVMKFNGEEIGPVKSCDYVKKSREIVDWSSFQVIEPIPVTPNGQLYWEVRVVPNDGSGISYTAFVEPVSGDVIECRNDVDIQKFLKGAWEPSEDDNNTITGELLDIDVFVQDGNTRWILNVNDTIIFANAEDINTTIISVLINLEIGDEIRITFEPPNYLRDVRKANE